jgi:hypothetical protein
MSGNMTSMDRKNDDIKNDTKKKHKKCNEDLKGKMVK